MLQWHPLQTMQLIAVPYLQADVWQAGLKFGATFPTLTVWTDQTTAAMMSRMSPDARLSPAEPSAPLLPSAPMKTPPARAAREPIQTGTATLSPTVAATTGVKTADRRTRKAPREVVVLAKPATVRQLAAKDQKPTSKAAVPMFVCDAAKMLKGQPWEDGSAAAAASVARLEEVMVSSDSDCLACRTIASIRNRTRAAPVVCTAGIREGMGACPGPCR